MNEIRFFHNNFIVNYFNSFWWKQ